MAERLQKLAEEMVRHDFAAMALNAGPTLSYLTGLNFHLMERPVLMVFVPGADPVIVLPELELPKLESLPFALRVHPYGENPLGWPAVFARALGELGLGGERIGVEPRQMRLLEYELLRTACGDARCLDGLACGFQSQIAAGHIAFGKVACADAGTFDDPLIGGLDASFGQLGHEVIVGHTARRQIAACARNT